MAEWLRRRILNPEVAGSSSAPTTRLETLDQLLGPAGK